MWETVCKLTIIFTTSEFWIDSITIARQNVNAGAENQVALTLKKGGRIVGISAVKDTTNGVPSVTIGVRNGDNTEITYGQASTALEVFLRNDGVGNVPVGAHVLIYLR